VTSRINAATGAHRGAQMAHKRLALGLKRRSLLHPHHQDQYSVQ